MKKTKLVIIDDHPILAEGIASLLDRKGSSYDITRARTGEEALEKISSDMADVAVVDVSLPDMDGTELIGRLRKVNPLLHVVVYTMHDEPWVVKGLQRAEADAVVLKSDDMEELIIAIESARLGIPYFSPRFRSLAANSSCGLKNREMEILQYVGDGMQSVEIAKRLCVTENTIEYHRRKLMRKFGASNNASLVSMAIAKGVIKPKQ